MTFLAQGTTAINKRQKEKARQEKQREKALKRQQRREQSGQRLPVAPGEDPDIAGIVPGPQPPPEGFDDDDPDVEERS